MIRDARSLAPDEQLRARICVLGAGAAGITVARDLAAAGHDVLLVESGGFELEEETQALHEMEMTGALFGPEDDPYPVTTTRLRMFGGTTNHWAGYCRPLRPIDFEVRPGLARSGWDLTHDEVAAWYPRATEILHLRSDRFDPEYWADRVGHGPPLLDGPDVETVVFQLSPVNFGSVYREELERSERITVLLHANATQLLTDESGGRVSTVTVRTLEGGRASIEADVVVVALGGLETPRLLLASNERGGLGNDRDLVGRFFCEHFQHTLGFAVVDRSAEELAHYRPQEYATDAGPAVLQSCLVVSDDQLREHGLLGMEVQLLASDLAGTDLPRVAAGPGAHDLAAVAGAVIDRGLGSLVLCQVFAEQEVNPSSRVTLTDELDPLGMPRASLHWAHTELDRRSIATGLELVGRALGRRGLGRLQRTLGSARIAEGGTGLIDRFVIDPAQARPDFHLAHGNHHMGTTRLADDPASGVVDRNLKVHGIGNLYVAGSAVFPTPGVASPTITLVALSARLADHLHRQVLR